MRPSANAVPGSVKLAGQPIAATSRADHRQRFFHGGDNSRRSSKARSRAPE
jgi:hypothetical protein